MWECIGRKAGGKRRSKRGTPLRQLDPLDGWCRGRRARTCSVRSALERASYGDRRLTTEDELPGPRFNHRGHRGHGGPAQMRVRWAVAVPNNVEASCVFGTATACSALTSVVALCPL